MKVNVLKSFWCPQGTYNPGEPVEMPDTKAKEYIGLGYLEEVKEVPVAPVVVVVEKAKKPEKIEMKRQQAPAVEEM